MQGSGSWIVLVLRAGLWALLVLSPLTSVPAGFSGVTGAEAQESTQDPVDPLYFARWNINYGEYLIDVGKYLEALEAFQTAIEATTNPQVQAEAHLQRASTLAIFLDDIDGAASEYKRILQTSAQHTLAETARFRLGMLFFDQQRHHEAAEQFAEYLRQHPKGRFAPSAEFLLARSRAAAAKRPTAVTEPPAAPGTPPAEPVTPPAAVSEPPVEPARPPEVVVKKPDAPSTPPAAVPKSPLESVKPPESVAERPGVSPEPPAAPTTARRPPTEERVGPAESTPSTAVSPPVAAPSIQRVPVRVRLIKRTQRVVVRGATALQVTTVGGESLAQGQNEVLLRPGRDGIVVGKRSTTAREVRITAATPVTLVSRTIRCFRRDQEAPGVYRGSMRVFLDEGHLRVVNEIDIEHYLYGVVPAEVPSSWPPEALKALAIAARTYALYQAKHRSDWTYDLVDSDGDQVYRGRRCETKRTNRAVDATRGMLLIHAQRPILAMYTSNTGWHSASARHIFDTTLPYLTGVQDPYSPTQPMGRWRRTHDAQEIRQKLQKIGLRFGTIQDIVPQAVTPSGRITKVKLVSSRGTKVLRARSTIRRALDLPEVLLNITRQEQTYIFEGGGFGHGVGLSQWGAKEMASKGKSAPDILRFYYRNVRVERVW